MRSVIVHDAFSLSLSLDEQAGRRPSSRDETKQSVQREPVSHAHRPATGDAILARSIPLLYRVLSP